MEERPAGLQILYKMGLINKGDDDNREWRLIQGLKGTLLDNVVNL
jgi:hypothetical protein